LALLFAFVVKSSALAASGTNLIIFERRVPGLSKGGLARFVSRAKRAVRLTGGVDVMITNNRELRRLNQRFRGKDQATDVLSFPAAPGRSDGFAGEIAISAEIATQNAHRLGHTAREEVTILALHGILHLAGYDHERDDGAMASKEAHLRRWLGLPLGLIERNTEPHRNRRSVGRRNSRKVRAKRGALPASAP